jgi:hypothetical protein
MRGTICRTHGHRLFLILEPFAKNALLKRCIEFCTIGKIVHVAFSDFLSMLFLLDQKGTLSSLAMFMDI